MSRVVVAISPEGEVLGAFEDIELARSHVEQLENQPRQHVEFTHTDLHVQPY